MQTVETAEGPVAAGHAPFGEDPNGFLALAEPFLLDASGAPGARR